MDSMKGFHLPFTIYLALSSTGANIQKANFTMFHLNRGLFRRRRSKPSHPNFQHQANDNEPKQETAQITSKKPRLENTEHRNSTLEDAYSLTGKSLGMFGIDVESMSNASLPYADATLQINDSHAPQRQPRRSSFLRKSSSSTSSKRVSFTEYSSVSIYIEDFSSARRRWYTCKDMYQFNAEAVLESQRIRDVISKYDLDTTSSIFQLIEHRVLSCEDILGIEHKVSGVKRATERRRHSYHLLDHQDELKNKNEMDCTKLAAVSNNSSFKSAELARFRAALAA